MRLAPRQLFGWRRAMTRHAADIIRCYVTTDDVSQPRRAAEGNEYRHCGATKARARGEEERRLTLALLLFRHRRYAGTC